MRKIGLYLLQPFLMLVCLVYFFPSENIQSICVPESTVCLLQISELDLVFVLFIMAPSSLWVEYSIQSHFEYIMLCLWPSFFKIRNQVLIMFCVPVLYVSIFSCFIQDFIFGFGF